MVMSSLEYVEHMYICIFSVSAGAVRALRKGRRGDMGCLYMASKKVCCRSESMKHVK